MCFLQENLFNMDNVQHVQHIQTDQNGDDGTKLKIIMGEHKMIYSVR